MKDNAEGMVPDQRPEIGLSVTVQNGIRVPTPLAVIMIQTSMKQHMTADLLQVSNKGNNRIC